MRAPKEIADGLMETAARQSLESPLGWACPDCEILEEAARIIRRELPKDNSNPDVTLSNSPHVSQPE